MSGAWFLGRTRWRRHWRGLVFLAVVAGLVGGAVLGALAGARRTATAYDRLTAASNAPDGRLIVLDRPDDVAAFLARSPLVTHAEPALGFLGRQSPHEDWYSLDAPFDAETRRTPVLEQGRLPDPTRADEASVTLRVARNAGIDVGDEVAFTAYARDEITDVIDDPWTVPSGQEIRVRVVGIVRDPSDAQLSQTGKVVMGTPALARQYRGDTPTTIYSIWLDGGPDASAAFGRALTEFSRTGEAAVFESIRSEATADSANHSARAVVTGLLIFAAVAAIAGLAIVVQAVRRHLATAQQDDETLSALGALRPQRACVHFVASLPFLLLSAPIAVAVALATSPLFPLGASRWLEPEPGVHGDLLALTAGGVAMFVVLGALTIGVAWASTHRQLANRTSRVRRSNPSAANASLLPAEIGFTFALRPGGRRRAVRRAALAGTVIAVVGVVSSALFVASLDAFTSSPSRYGLPYDVTLEVAAGNAPTLLDELASEPALEAVGAASGGVVDLDGTSINAYSVESAKGTIEPVLRDGRLPAALSEIAVGPRLLDRLDKSIGDRVTVTDADGEHELTIVGTVLSPMPESNDFNAELLLTPEALSQYASNPYVQAVARIAPGTDHGEVIADLDGRYPYAVSDESLPNGPGPVRNVDQIARLPFALMLFFAFLGAAALSQSLFVTASERGRDLAVLRSLGFTRSQSRAVLIAAAASVTVAACALGIPIGVLLGRVGWRAVADNLFVAPGVVVPIAPIAGAVGGLLVFALIVATARARRNNRFTVGAALRAE